MASFLEQINSKENRPAPIVTEKKPEERKEEPAGPKTETPRSRPAVQADPPRATAGKPANPDQPHGIRMVEHEAVVDRSYLQKRILAITAAVLVLVLLLGAGGFLIYKMRLVEVKNFSGRSIAEMRKWATEYGLILDEHSIYNDQSTEGIVLEQDVAAGVKLSPKSIISVTVSSGADPSEKVTVPDLASMTAAQIREWITEQKLISTKITEQNSDTVPRGSVIRYEFSSVSVGPENFRRNDGLTVYVSKGPTQTQPVNPSDLLTVPDYSSVMKEDAQNYNGSFSVTVKTVYSDSAPYGGFIEQYPAADTKVSKTQNGVTVYYSLGRPFLPILTGKNESEIPELFYNLNRNGAELHYEVRYVEGAEMRGQVISASHENEYVEVGATVILSICRRGSLVVPDLSLYTREEVASAVKGFTVQVKNIYDNTVPYGAYIRQSVAAGTALTDPEEVITVYYSLGRPYLPDLRGRGESELPEYFYNLNADGANITYQIEYVTSGATPGTVFFISARNEYILVGTSILIRIAK